MKIAENYWLIVLSGALLCLLLWTPDAFAYRPFDSTDASVAGPGEFELEFGPVGHLREGRERSFIAPAFIANFGISDDREIVLEGKLKTFQGNLFEGSRTSLVDTALSLKQVHRRGSLQDGIGPSIASECGMLLPTIHAESGTGASCALIGSQRWTAGTIHLNGALAFNREHRWNRFFGAIFEGPNEWTVRPVAELFTEQEVGGAQIRSGLLGVIWRAHENLAFDFGVRLARTGDTRIHEVRAGLTWTLSSAKR
jgi:hypothetical protein